MELRKIGVGVVWNRSGTHVLIDRRLPGGAFGGFWEFPGGKIEPGETAEACIHRELAEELGIAVLISKHLITIDYTYGAPESPRQITLIVYECVHKGGEPQPLQCSEVRWVSPVDLPAYTFPSANYQILEAILGHRELS